MKQITRLLTCVVLVLGMMSCGNNASDKVKEGNVTEAKKRDEAFKGFAVVEFSENTFDFGEIIQGDKVEHTFIIKNTGQSPLIISNARASCGCTVPKYTEEPIAPNGTGELHVQFNSTGKSGKQRKSISLTTNTEKGREVVYITANINKKENK